MVSRAWASRAPASQLHMTRTMRNALLLALIAITGCVDAASTPADPDRFAAHPLAAGNVPLEAATEPTYQLELTWTVTDGVAVVACPAGAMVTVAVETIDDREAIVWVSHHDCADGGAQLVRGNSVHAFITDAAGQTLGASQQIVLTPRADANEDAALAIVLSAG